MQKYNKGFIQALALIIIASLGVVFFSLNKLHSIKDSPAKAGTCDMSSVDDPNCKCYPSDESHCSGEHFNLGCKDADGACTITCQGTKNCDPNETPNPGVCGNSGGNVCGDGCIKWICPKKDTNGDGECDARDTGAYSQTYSGTGCPGVTCGDDCCQIDYTSGGSICHPPDCKEINWICPTPKPTPTVTPGPTLTPTPTPTATPTAAPTLTPTPSPTPTGNVTPTPTPTTTLTPTITPTPSETPTSTPNWCNGTCGSNYNCQGGYFCHDGYCRNPSCVDESDCDCTTATPTSTAPPVLGATAPPVLPKTGGGIGDMFALLGAGSLGIYLIRHYRLI